MTHQRHSFTELTQMVRNWVDDTEATIRRSTSWEHILDPAMQANVRELKLNLPKARRALRELTQAL